jgi:hypothetical protein
MKRSTPLKRTPFARSQPEREARPERIKPVATPLARPVRYAQPANDPVAAVTKTAPKRNPHLLTMAKGQRCFLRVPDVCCNDPATTVACHSNWTEHGKAGARKADDCYHVWGCFACHAWLDQGDASAEEKREAFDSAFAWMVAIWRDITQHMQPATPKDRAAAQWALDRLQTPVERAEVKARPATENPATQLPRPT